MLTVTYAECHYAECHYAECHYAECRYAECHGAFKSFISTTRTMNKSLFASTSGTNAVRLLFFGTYHQKS
jgi:hypothetical protein